VLERTSRRASRGANKVCRRGSVAAPPFPSEADASRSGLKSGVCVVLAFFDPPSCILCTTSFCHCGLLPYLFLSSDGRQASRPERYGIFLFSPICA